MKRKTTDERMRAAAAKAKPSNPPESWIICHYCREPLSTREAKAFDHEHGTAYRHPGCDLADTTR